MPRQMGSLPLSPRPMHALNFTVCWICCRKECSITIPIRRSLSANIGPYLGKLTNELRGDYITAFVSGGPKNYSYRTNTDKVETKVRSITLDCTTKQKVNFNVIGALVYLHAQCHVTGRITVDIPFKITRDVRSKKTLK